MLLVDVEALDVYIGHFSVLMTPKVLHVLWRQHSIETGMLAIKLKE